MIFEWDEDKAQINESNHGVSFEEARTVFNDPFALTVPDSLHSTKEERWLDLGRSAAGRFLVVWYTERRGRIRIIGSRRATKTERRMYEEA